MPKLETEQTVPSPIHVRPLEPAWLSKFLSTKKMDKMKIKVIVSALGRYNKACNKAAEKLAEDLKKL